MEAILRTRIKNIEENIFHFYLLVKKQHEEAIKAIMDNDLAKISQIIQLETKVNQEYNFLFKNTFYDLAKYHFFGVYLRKVLGYFYIANELERIGDYANSICLMFLKEELTKQEITVLVNVWKRLLSQFEQVEKLFFLKDISLLLSFLQDETINKINLKDLAQNLNIIYFKKNHLFSQGLLYFLRQFHVIERSFDRLGNIVEYLLLIRSFAEFQKYKKN